MTAGIAAVPRPVVGTPSGAETNMINNKISIGWKKVSGATGYEIYYAIGSKDNYKLLERTSKNQMILNLFQKNKTYYFKIRAREKVNGVVFKGKFSRQISVKTAIDKPKSVSTIKKLLKAAMLPVGKTMYVWGGGWNKEDTGSGIEAVTMGVSPAWETFFNQQDSRYNYENTRYQIHNGLDCSGYVGWCIYNALNTTSGNEGYVISAEQMAANYSSRGWGTYIGRSRVIDYKPGDIMSSDCVDCGHVWIVVGQCSDGSVVLVHSSPAGVQLNGTVNRNGSQNSEAVKLATYYMKKNFPKWYNKFPNCSRGESYLSHYAQIRWNVSGKSVLNDPEGYQKKNAEEVLQDLF